MGSLGTIGGTFLAPGVSLNDRLYTAEAIGKAVKRMAARIADPNGLPITMLTHHEADDDSTRITARVTAVAQQGDGSATWEGRLVDSEAGRTIAALTEPDDTGRRALESVSIRGWWIGPVTCVNHDGKEVSTAEDIEVDGIDFTKSPGVTQARIVSSTKLAERAGQRTPIFESAPETHAEVPTTTGEAKDPKKPYGDVTYADPGYQPDGVSRYPLDTKKHSTVAWNYINQSSNQKPYTTQQVKLIKGRIKSAASKLGVTISDETVVQASLDDLAEAVEAYISVSAYQGPADVDVRAFGIPNDDIAAAATRLGQASAAALQVLDPDNDGDLDLDQGDQITDCTACHTALPAGATFCPGCGAAVSSGDVSAETATPEEPTVASENTTETPASAATESTPPATGQQPAGSGQATGETATGQQPSTEQTGDTGTPGLSAADLDALAERLAKHMTPAAAPAEETTPATESTPPAPGDQPPAQTPAAPSAADIAAIVAKAVGEQVNGLREQMLKDYGPPTRKGLLREAAQAAADSGGPDLHKMSPSELNAHAAKAWDTVLGPVGQNA